MRLISGKRLLGSVSLGCTPLGRALSIREITKSFEEAETVSENSSDLRQVFLSFEILIGAILSPF